MNFSLVNAALILHCILEIGSSLHQPSVLVIQVAQSLELCLLLTIKWLPGLAVDTRILALVVSYSAKIINCF